MAEEQFLFLSGSVKLKGGGVKTLRRGDHLPADADGDDVARLSEMGALGAQAASNPAQGPGASSASSDEELVAFAKEATAKQLIAAAADDAELAERLLEAEIASREKPRKSVVEALEEQIEGSSASSDEEPASQE